MEPLEEIVHLLTDGWNGSAAKNDQNNRQHQRTDKLRMGMASLKGSSHTTIDTDPIVKRCQKI